MVSQVLNLHFVVAGLGDLDGEATHVVDEGSVGAPVDGHGAFLELKHGGSLFYIV